MTTRQGQFFCLDAAWGETLWTGDPRQSENAAMVIAGNSIFFGLGCRFPPA